MKIQTSVNPLDVEGIWAEYVDNVSFRIGRASNEVYLKAADKIDSKFRKQIRTGKLGTKQSIDNTCRAMAEGILLDWKGINDSEGAKLPYNKENAYLALRHNPEIRDFVHDFATEIENYRSDEIKATSKK